MSEATLNVRSVIHRQGLSWPVAFLAGATAVALVAGLYLGLVFAPEEAVQGPPQRIFYIHVPALWVGFLAFFVVFVASIGYLVTRRLGWDIVARSAAEIGTVFLTAGIFTGSIWARPIWGTWWSWDARGTTTLVLWLIFVAYMMLRSTSGQTPRTARFAAVLGIIGFLNVPLVYYSVQLWRTLHPGPTIAAPEGSGGLPPEMLLALLVSLLGFTLLYALLMVYRVRWDRAREDVERLQAELGV